MCLSRNLLYFMMLLLFVFVLHLDPTEMLSVVDLRFPFTVPHNPHTLLCRIVFLLVGHMKFYVHCYNLDKPGSSGVFGLLFCT